jgi:hypothetical protein
MVNIIQYLNNNGNNITQYYHGHYHEKHKTEKDNIKYVCVEINKIYKKL